MTTRLIELEAARLLEPHPFATLMPTMRDSHFAELARDVAANGQRMPIILHEGKVLDGRHRLRACIEAGRGVWAADYAGNNPMQFALSSNLQRRHLAPSQAAVIAARMVSTRHGVNASAADTTQAMAAQLVGVSERYVRDAQWLQEHEPTIADDVFNGLISLSAAMRRARPVHEEEREERAPLIDPHTAPLAQSVVEADAADLILRAAVHMEGADPGAWVEALPSAARVAALRALERFARLAYDHAEEAGIV